MTYKTPAAIGGKGLEMLPGYPNAHLTPSQNTGQGHCATCTAFAPTKTMFLALAIASVVARPSKVIKTGRACIRTTGAWIT